jgi:hypothetical protein
VFDETNGSQVEQVDLDELDDEEAPCVALRNMSIGDECPKESEEPTQAQDQPSSSMQASLPTQDEDQAQDDENEDQEEPPQEEDNDQGGDANDQDNEDDQGPRPPHPRVHQAIQRDHPVNSILGDIHKGVTTRSRVAHLNVQMCMTIVFANVHEKGFIFSRKDPVVGLLHTRGGITLFENVHEIITKLLGYFFTKKKNKNIEQAK